MKIRAAVLVVCAVILSAVAVQGQDKLSLKLKAPKGRVWDVKVASKQTITQSIMGNEITIHQEMLLGYEYRVQNVDKQGNTTLKITFTSVKFHESGPMGVTRYSSETAEPPQGAAVGFAALPGKSYTVTMSPSGEVLSMTGVADMMASIFAFIDNNNAATNELIKQSMRASFGEDAIKETMEINTDFYPKAEVSPGDTWTSSVIINNGFPMILANKYTYKGKEEGLAVIEQETEIEPNKAAKFMKVPGMDMRYMVQGTQKGEYRIDPATGIFMNGKIDMNLHGNVEARNEDGKTIQFPMTLTTKQEIKATPHG